MVVGGAAAVAMGYMFGSKNSAGPDASDDDLGMTPSTDTTGADWADAVNADKPGARGNNDTVAQGAAATAAGKANPTAISGGAPMGPEGPKNDSVSGNEHFDALPKRIQKDLRSLGIDGSRFSVEGSSVSMQVRMVGQPSAARVGELRRALNYFQNNGYSAVTVQTGPVINSRLAERLSNAIINDKPFLGMQVTNRGMQHLNGTNYPSFMLQWFKL
jgi:hypothetical protein